MPARKSHSTRISVGFTLIEFARSAEKEIKKIAKSQIAAIYRGIKRLEVE